MSVPPYGTAIQDAIARGNLREMKALAKSVEQLVAKTGDLKTFYSLLKLEIAKVERKSK